MALKPTNNPKIECRYCGCRMNSVTHVESHEVQYMGRKRTITKRYRKCRHCGLQFTTIETYEDDDNSNLPDGIQPFKPHQPGGGVYSLPSIPTADVPLPPEKGRKRPSKRRD